VATAVASSADSSDAAGGDGGQTRRRTMSAVRLSSFANDMIMMFAS
jgi:protein subunit release factor A